MKRQWLMMVSLGLALLGCDDSGGGEQAQDTATVEDSASDAPSDTTGDAAEDTVEAEVGCTSGADCDSGVCDEETGACLEPACDDGVQNGTESDVDCGGSCLPCSDGGACASAEDCVSANCVDSLCAEASCTDGKQNGFESDVDCGGGECPACAESQGCFENSDCASGSCDVVDDVGTCILETCEDGALNNDETGTDCGGPNCDPCGAGGGCDGPVDCESFVCVDSLCAEVSCADGLRNGEETYIDCGGSVCDGCAAGDACAVNEDCESLLCAPESFTCIAASCSDGVTNSGESDVDCGGDNCAPCSTGQTCNGPADCTSGICAEGVCGAPVESCAAINDVSPDTPTGSYLLALDGGISRPRPGWCDMTADGGGWTLISVVRNDSPAQIIVNGKNYCDSLDPNLACKGHIPVSAVTSERQLLIMDLSQKDTWMILDNFNVTSPRTTLRYFSGERQLTTSSTCLGYDHYCGSAAYDTKLRIFKTSGLRYSYNPPLKQWWRYGGWWIGADPNSGGTSGNVFASSYSKSHRLSSRADANGANALHSSGHQAIFWR